MAHFGKDVEGFSASRTLKIVGTDTVENYTVGGVNDSMLSLILTKIMLVSTDNTKHKLLNYGI